MCICCQSETTNELIKPYYHTIRQITVPTIHFIVDKSQFDRDLQLVEASCSFRSVILIVTLLLCRSEAMPFLSPALSLHSLA